MQQLCQLLTLQDLNLQNIKICFPLPQDLMCPLKILRFVSHWKF